jgi:chromosome partitioning protein
MQVITLLNEKGGVGKTTLATHIAAGLALRGARVVLIDADPQGHAGYALGINYEPGLYNLLVRNAPWKDVLRMANPGVYDMPGQPVNGQLFVLPGNTETRSIAQNVSDALIVRKRFAELDGHVDYVIVDTSPTPSLLHGAIYLATHALLYPTRCEALSFQGLLSSFDHRVASDKFRAESGMTPIAVLGIVPTMFRKKTTEHRENLDKLKASYDGIIPVWDAISQATVWTEAHSFRCAVWNLAPDTNAAHQALEMVDRFASAVQVVV